ncbi:hypothetical protein SO802_022291 [Lithocarpus litseifolius]|uniref:Uncharacterized protein n=1 Tax=Lithocarpus litseifolius TaxID=425828 RepID=A0AAW2CM48_9ROSI
MSSIFINAPSSSSSMKSTYPPTNKPSKQELKPVIANPHGTKELTPLCFARAHLLHAWDVVAATVGLCIHGAHDQNDIEHRRSARGTNGSSEEAIMMEWQMWSLTWTKLR